MTDIQKQMAEALDAVDKNAVRHCATEYSIDRETLLKVQQALAAHRQQEATGPVGEVSCDHEGVWGFKPTKLAYLVPSKPFVHDSWPPTRFDVFAAHGIKGE